MTRRLVGAALAAALAALAGCGGGEMTGTGGAGGTTTQTTSQGGTGGLGCADVDEPAPAPADWCERIVSGPKSGASAAVSWSAAHARARFFGAVESYAAADQALAGAFVSDDAFAGKDLSMYANALPGVVCAAPASSATLGPASVRAMGEVAIVKPGTGAVELPQGTKAVLIDLRGLPSVTGLRETTAEAIAPAITTPIAGLSARVRKHDGMVDEVFSATNVYTSSVTKVALPDIAAGGSADLPLAVLTDARLPADAVEIAATLRVAKRAWIVGEGLRIEVAEATWQGIGDSGVAIRYRDLFQKGGARLPDAIEADRRMGKPECFAEEILARGVIPEVAAGAADRPQVRKMSPFGEAQAPGDALGDARAALVIAHGAARMFYPYFPTVGDTIDDRLEETLAALPAVPTREDERQALRRFGNALVDGHNFIIDGEPAIVGYCPVYIEDVDGAPVVRRSGDAAISAGDTITSIGGVAASAWYQAELARSGGATPGYRFNLATRQLIAMSGPVELGVVDVNGVAKTVTVQPHPAADFTAVGVASSRGAGLLGDLGAPQLYYVNLDGSVLGNIAAFRSALMEAATAKGLVVDMRGYPGIDHYEAAQRLVQVNFSSPIFRTKVLTGLDEGSVNEESYSEAPLASPSFEGPIALLVGHSTVSAAENFSTMLVDAQRVHVVGRTSAGTNGNITGVQVPGDFGFTFTGMEVRHADAGQSVFHGVGIVPHIEVALTAQDFAGGGDPELEAAVGWLMTQ